MVGTVQGSDGGRDYLVVDVLQPLTWLRQLEQANIAEDGSGMHLWDMVSRLVKSRHGGSDVDANWPGFAYVPNSVIREKILSHEISIPEGWGGNTIEVLTRLISSLLAWNVERRILQFTHEAARVVRNSSVDIPLLVSSFEGLPGYSCYFDTSNIREEELDFPQGFFVSLNVRDGNIPEIIFVLDYGDCVDVRALPLNGEHPDDIYGEIISAWRKEVELDSTDQLIRPSVPAALSEFDATLQILLASVLTASACCDDMEMLNPDIAGNSIYRPAVQWWVVGLTIDAAIQGMRLTRGDVGANQDLIIGVWHEKSDGEIELRFSSGGEASAVVINAVRGPDLADEKSK